MCLGCNRCWLMSDSCTTAFNGESSYVVCGHLQEMHYNPLEHHHSDFSQMKFTATTQHYAICMFLFVLPHWKTNTDHFLHCLVFFVRLPLDCCPSCTEEQEYLQWYGARSPMNISALGPDPCPCPAEPWPGLEGSSVALYELVGTPCPVPTLSSIAWRGVKMNSDVCVGRPSHGQVTMNSAGRIQSKWLCYHCQSYRLGIWFG